MVQGRIVLSCGALVPSQLFQGRLLTSLSPHSILRSLGQGSAIGSILPAPPCKPRDIGPQANPPSINLPSLLLQPWCNQTGSRDKIKLTIQGPPEDSQPDFQRA